MRKIFRIISINFILLLIAFPGNTEMQKIKGIAVVNAKFDDIGKILTKYGIEFRTYNYSDLEKKEIFANCRAIFFPCGVDSPIETNVNILSRGTKIHSVSLKKDFLDIDEKKIYKNIKSFIEEGGNAYFSDYSYKIFSGAFNSMEFYDDFPNLGLIGNINLDIKSDLYSFCKERGMNVFMPHPGWVVVKSITNSKTLAESTFNTIRDMKSSPIISLMRQGKGEAIFTSWHTGSDETPVRYIIHRLVYRYLSDELMSNAAAWEQDINGTIVDSIKAWENCRSYYLPVKKGNNTIYFTGEKGLFQIDIFDRDKKLIISEDQHKSRFNINIKSDEEQDLYIKVFPGNSKMNGVFSILSASGIRIIPYFKKILISLAILGFIALLFWTNKTFGLKKFSGRFR